MPITGTTPKRRMSAPVLGAFLTIAVGVGSLVGIITKPGYGAGDLIVPWYFPQPWMVPPIFLVTYIASAVAAWRLWVRNGFDGWFGLLPRSVVQLLLNWLWSPFFFIWELHLLALPIVIAAFWVTMTVLRRVRRADLLAAKMLRICLFCFGYFLCINVAVLYLNA